MFVCSVRIDRPLANEPKSVFTAQILLDIVSMAETSEFPKMLVSFFSFLRLSNMVPQWFWPFQSFGLRRYNLF